MSLYIQWNHHDTNKTMQDLGPWHVALVASSDSKIGHHLVLHTYAYKAAAISELLSKTCSKWETIAMVGPFSNKVEAVKFRDDWNLSKSASRSSWIDQCRKVFSMACKKEREIVMWLIPTFSMVQLTTPTVTNTSSAMQNTDFTHVLMSQVRELQKSRK